MFMEQMGELKNYNLPDKYKTREGIKPRIEGFNYFNYFEGIFTNKRF